MSGAAMPAPSGTGSRTLPRSRWDPAIGLLRPAPQVSPARRRVWYKRLQRPGFFIDQGLAEPNRAIRRMTGYGISSGREAPLIASGSGRLDVSLRLISQVLPIGRDLAKLF